MAAYSSNFSIVKMSENTLIKAFQSYYREYPNPRLANPATPSQLAQAEKVLGFELPLLLRELYLKLGNGGFGPEILGLDEAGWQDGCGGEYNIVSKYLQVKACWQNDGEIGQWQTIMSKMLPISYGGCTDHYFVDCGSRDNPVWLGEDDGTLQKLVAPSLSGWLEQWLNKHLVVDQLWNQA